MLSNDTRQFLHDALAKMVSPVRLVFFTQGRAAAERGRGVPADEEIGCEGCVPTGQILRDIASLSALITIEEHNLVLERERAATYRVTGVPKTVVNETGEILGALPEEEFVRQALSMGGAQSR